MSATLLILLGLITQSIAHAGMQPVRTAQEKPPDKVARDAWVLKDGPCAVQKAQELLNVRSDAKAGKVTARLATLGDDNTPFLHSALVGRRLWHIVMHEWSIELSAAEPGAEDCYERTLDVYLDPQGGHLLKIRTRWPENEPPMPAEPTADDAEEQLRQASNERYLGFPADPPKITFVEALESLYRSGVNVSRAKQLVARCVIWSTDYDKPKAVWAITLRGVPPYRVPVASWPKGDVYEYRYLVDAETGVYESVTNVPWGKDWDPPLVNKNDRKQPRDPGQAESTPGSGGGR